MTRVHHLQAAALAIFVLLGGELFCGFWLPGTLSLRGSNSIEEMIERSANETLETFLKTVNEQSLKREELSPLVERLENVETKLGNKQVPDKKDISDLEKRLAMLDGKLKSHEGSSVNDEDLKALEEKLAGFEAKMKDQSVSEQDMAILKLRMRQFESKLQTQGNKSVGKDNLKNIEGLVSSLETNSQALNKTAAQDNDRVPSKNVPVQAFKKKGVAATSTANDPDAVKQDIQESKTLKKPNEKTFDPPPHKVKAPKLSHDQVALLNTFNPKDSPILNRGLANTSKPVKTRVLLLSPKRWLQKYKNQEGYLRYISNEMSSIVLDGLEKSPYFENLEPTVIPDHRMNNPVVLEEKEDVVWLVDDKNFAPRTYANYSVDQEVLYAANATINYQKTLKKKPSLKVVFVDYREKTAGRSLNCGPERNALIKLLGAGNVRQVVGRVAVGRQWDSEKDWIDPGKVWKNQDYMCSGTMTIYSPYAARSDYVQAIQDLFPKHIRMKDRDKPGTTPVDTIRHQDIFFNGDQQNHYHSQLHGAVRTVVSSLKGTMIGSRKITTSTGISTKEEGSDGVGGVPQPYIESLLTSKIVVVAQRDIWDGDYGLFDALAGGALVMMDPMLAMPRGLVDGKNVIVYHSREDLEDMLLYYLSPEQEEVRLEIARNGYELAMGLHRTYHQVEEIFFGMPLSSSTLPLNTPKEEPPTRKENIPATVSNPLVKKSPQNKPRLANGNQGAMSSEVNANQSVTRTPVKKEEDQSSILTTEEIALLETFNPEHAPILGNKKPDIKNPARVRVLLMKPKKRKMRAREVQTPNVALSLLGDEMVNIVLDGLQRSPYFESLDPTVVNDFKISPDFVLEEDEDVTWVVDSRNLTLPTYDFSVDGTVLQAAKATVKYQESLNAANKPSLSVVFVDYHDKLAGRNAMCSPEREELIKLLGVGNVRHVVGKVVAGRSWNSDTEWTERGTIWDNKDHQCFQKPTLRAPYTVRSDYAEAVEEIFPRFLDNTTSKEKLTPVDTVRPLDVAHYWDQERAVGREQEYRYYSKLRSAVSAVVSSLNGTMAGNRKIKSLAATISEGGSIGRTGVHKAYLESLLTTKIVVVAQRDIWEDHYRLFEAFVGGAMVMTDLMISLPSGLVDGQNVVMYKSLDNLKELLLHYLDPKQDEARLEIARKGYEVAMTQHRSHHRMEEVFYGKRLSKSTIPTISTQPKEQPRKSNRASVATLGKQNHVAKNPREHLANIKRKRAKKPEQR